MDPRRSNELLKISEFKGMHTNPPRGLVPAPVLLRNAYLNRTGGYSPQWTRSVQVRSAGSVAEAISAGVGRDLFFSLGNKTYLAIFNPEPDEYPLIGPALAGAARIMPGLLLSADGKYYLTKSGMTPQSLTPPSVSGYNPDDATTHPLQWSYVQTESGGYNAEVTREWLIVFERGGIATFKTGATVGVPPEHYNILLIQRSGTFTGATVYSRLSSYSNWQFTAFLPPGDVQMLVGPDVPVRGLAYLPMRFTQLRATEYHQGRIYIAGTVETIKVEQDATTLTEAHPARLYYSDTIASASSTNLPRFTLDQYIDVPFRVSRRIVSVVSVGNYLYIFGDRELWLMTGDPATTGRLEQLGDSIGSVHPGSVQQLQGVVYWLSDSGLLAAQGGQLREVGEPVRDLLLDMQNPTSTVDFRRELYLISDGADILCYHARENGWTLRQNEGQGPVKLLYGGGTAYMLQDGAVWSIGGDQPAKGIQLPPPTRLPMRVQFPHTELGEWRLRKVWQGVAFGVDLESQPATVENHSTVDGAQVSTTQQTVSPTGAGQVKMHLTHNGTNAQGLALALDLTITTQDKRGIMRPPLTVFGTAGGEEAWTDEQR